jgi:acyl-CoA hydrolase/GNAT superfamily N-acetyltransferase
MLESANTPTYASTSSSSSSESSTSNKPKEWKDKEIKLEDIPSKLSNGSKIYIQSCAATAEASLGAMVEDLSLANIQIIQMIPGGTLPHLTESADRFRTSSFYSFTRTNFFQTEQRRNLEGLSDYTPVGISQINRLLQEKLLHVDVSIIKVTPPHKGFVSLGIGVEDTMAFIRHSKIVIAEINEHMPWTEGPTKIPIDAIDWWIPVNKPLLTTMELWPDFLQLPSHSQEVLDQIGRNVVKEIADRSTIHFGISPLLFSMVKFLRERKDLGLHSDLLTETFYELHKEGVITNKYKTIHNGRSVVSQAHGSTELYDFCDRNPVIEFHPGSYSSDPQTLAKIDNLVSVIGALKVDVTGQVSTDSIAHKFYGGVYSDEDSIRGAKFSKGGKPIVVVPSKSLSGRSNIVFALPPGTGVSITRSDVEYVITEIGTAYLYGKSIRERCLAMINIAHPDFRQELMHFAKENRYISMSQPGRFLSTNYPSELETLHQTKLGKSVLVRPVKVTDEDYLRNFFHKLSDHSVYLRYFRKLKSMPQKILQKTADVDYSKDMAIVVVSPPDGYHYELVALGQWVSDPRGGISEMAFQVRDDWQGEGLGKYLFQRLVEIAKQQNIPYLKADVLNDNKGMKMIFERGGVSYKKRSDFGVMTYIFDLGSSPPS